MSDEKAENGEVPSFRTWPFFSENRPASGEIAMHTGKL